MEESKRQRQVAVVLQQELNGVFIKLNLTMIGGGMVSIANVKITPDLLEARVYISFFQVEDKKSALAKIEDRSWEIKKLLSEKVKGQLRRIPVINYYLDDTLDYVFKMEELFKQIEVPESPNENEPS